MIERIGNILKETSSVENDIVLVTCNSIIKSNDELVMGAGFAKECVAHDPSLPRRFGKIIKQISYPCIEGLRYGIFISEDMYFGAIQTKYHYKYDSSVELIQYSLRLLNTVAFALPFKKFHLPRPGCGNGNLVWERDVKYMCLGLPDNVFIWSK